MQHLAHYAAILMTLSLAPVTLAESNPTSCLEAAQARYEQALRQANGDFHQGMRACYDIIDLGHPVPGSACIKRVEDNQARDLATAATTLNQDKALCQAQ